MAVIEIMPKGQLGRTGFILAYSPLWLEVRTWSQDGSLEVGTEAKPLEYLLPAGLFPLACSTAFLYNSFIGHLRKGKIKWDGKWPVMLRMLQRVEPENAGGEEIVMVDTWLCKLLILNSEFYSIQSKMKLIRVLSPIQTLIEVLAHRVRDAAQPVNCWL